MKVNDDIVRLPELTSETLEAIMAERLAATKTAKTTIPMLWQGILELPVLVNGLQRTAKYFIPKDTPQGTAIVILNVPEGKQTLPFLEESGWMAAAETESFCLFALEPAPGGWGTPEEEEPYLQAAVQEVKVGHYCLAAFAPYVVGYGAIGVGLHKIVMADPLHTAAAVFLNAGNVDAVYREEYESKNYLVSDSFDPAAEGLCVPYRDIPVPIWIVSEKIDSQTEAMLEYWKKAAKAGEPKKNAVLGVVYPQHSATEYTPEGNILKVALQTGSCDYCCCRTTNAIYNFLKQYYRYGMGPCSNMISKRIDFKAIGTEHRHFTDSNGIDREYLVYVPEAYRNAKKKLPMIVAYHGASQSMRNMMANGLWYELADQEGMILVYPESTLVPMPGELNGGQPFAYRPLWSLMDPDNMHTDLDYANEMLDRVIAEFPVDESRIYCTGHSMGCMMTNYLGSSSVSHRFAAVGATSGVLRAREHSGTQPVPAFMTIGQFDLWSYQIMDEGDVTGQIDMWLVRDGFATEENVREVRISGASEIYREGLYNNYVWKDDKGIPWVRYAWISQKHHVHTFNENCIFWKQWFSRWHIGKDGRRRYQESSEKEAGRA